MIHISFGISTYIGVITLALIKETSRVNLLSSAYVNSFFSIILLSIAILFLNFPPILQIFGMGVWRSWVKGIGISELFGLVKPLGSASRKCGKDQIKGVFASTELQNQ